MSAARLRGRGVAYVAFEVIAEALDGLVASESNAKLAEIGGRAYLEMIARSTANFSAEAVDDAAREVCDASAARCLIDAAEELGELAADLATAGFNAATFRAGARDITVRPRVLLERVDDVAAPVAGGAA
jgi:hypothetical protein